MVEGAVMNDINKDKGHTKEVNDIFNGMDMASKHVGMRENMNPDWYITYRGKTGWGYFKITIDNGFYKSETEAITACKKRNETERSEA